MKWGVVIVGVIVFISGYFTRILAPFFSSDPFAYHMTLWALMHGAFALCGLIAFNQSTRLIIQCLSLGIVAQKGIDCIEAVASIFFHRTGIGDPYFSEAVWWYEWIVIAVIAVIVLVFIYGRFRPSRISPVGFIQWQESQPPFWARKK